MLVCAPSEYQVLDREGRTNDERIGEWIGTDDAIADG